MVQLADLLHRQHSVTGVQIDLLQEYVFIALDIFKESIHNKNVEINNKLEAWLTFLSEDDSEYIMENFSKELAELDAKSEE